MNMKHLLLCFGLFSLMTATAQDFSCGTDENARKLRELYPEILNSEQELRAFTEWYKANKSSASRSEEDTTHYIIPVVFHILHDGGPENLPDSKIVGQEMTNINQYWSATNPELGGAGFPNIQTTFRDIVADMNIEFRLARKDPNGNPTNGIDRIYTNATRIGNNDTKINPWPRDKYLNIWVAKAVESDTGASGTIAYSMYPSGVNNQVNNDVIDGVQTKYVGVGVSAAYPQIGGFYRPVLAHEIGHWLNLQHTWGGTNQPGVACGDDEVDDTPPTYGQQNTCNITANTCHDDTTVSHGFWTSDVVDNVQNCMNYSECHIMFTEGQKERARAALTSTVAGRNNLWSPENLAATGVEPLYDVLPAPKAEFGLGGRYICAGQSVRFTDFSFNTSEWTREWYFSGDAEGVSGDDSIQNVTFTTPGWKTVTLIVSNASGSDTVTKTAVYVRDNNIPSMLYPYFQSFDDSSYQTEWGVMNYDNNVTAFTYRDGVGHNSNGSLGLNGYQCTYRGDRDELISPSFNLTGISEADFRLTFEWSMACRFEYELTNSYYDSIASVEVYIARGCTGTPANWKKVPTATIIGNHKLMNGGFVNASYVPGQGNQYWKKQTVNLAGGNFADYKTDDVRFRIVVNQAKNGNNFYFDNFNLGNSPVGINDEEVVFAALELYPNPAADNATLVITPDKEATFSVQVLDLLGKNVLNVFDGSIASEKAININTASLQKGIYLVQVSSNGKTQQQKLVKL